LARGIHIPSAANQARSDDAVGDEPEGLMFGYAAAAEHLVAPALRRLNEIWTS
jgi:hypothetical protein